MINYFLKLVSVITLLNLVACDDKKESQPIKVSLGNKIIKPINLSKKEAIKPKASIAEEVIKPRASSKVNFRPKGMPCRIVRTSSSSSKWTETWDLKYDETGRLTHSIRTANVTPPPPPEKRVYVYDKDNRLIKYMATEIAYNSNGTVKSTINDEGEKTTYKTDKRNNIIQGKAAPFGLEATITYKPYRSKINLPIPFGFGGNDLFVGEEKAYIQFKGGSKKLLRTVEYKGPNKAVSSITSDFGTLRFKYKCDTL